MYEPTTVEPPKLYNLKSGLLEALTVVGATYKPYTFKEILNLLKSYIFQHKHLLDPTNPLCVNCGGTPLGIAFNVDKFLYGEVRYHLSRSITCASSVNNSLDQSSSSSRPNNNNTNNNNSFKKDIMITVPYIPQSLSEPESEYSYQGYETALCHDSDSERVSASSDDHENQENQLVEYELVTETESNDQNSNDSGSDSENQDVIVILGISDHDELIESCFADESDPLSGSDTDVTGSEDELDRWKCLMCGISNKPFVRYCDKCWQLRKDWYPDRPKQRRKRKRKPRPKKEKIKSSLDVLSASETDAHSTVRDKGELDPPPKLLSKSELDPSLNLRRTDSSASTSTLNSMASGTSSQDSGFYTSQDCGSIKRKRSSEDEEDLNVEKQKIHKSSSEIEEVQSKIFARKFQKFASSTQWSQWLKSSKSKDLLEAVADFCPAESETEASPSDDFCSICCVRPKNASIIHGKISHIGFCYPCAKKIYNSGKSCPICRRKIHMITRNSYI